MPAKSPKKAAASARNTSDDATEFLSALTHSLKPVILALRTIIRGASDQINEGIKWNAPSYYTSEHFATFHLRATDTVQIIFHLGAKPRPDAMLRKQISDPDSLLEWRSADRAIATFRSLNDVESRRTSLQLIVQQWISHL